MAQTSASHPRDVQTVRRGAPCPVCRSAATVELFGDRMVPKYNLERHLTREAALQAPRGVLDFRFCTTCQFAFNAAFDQAEMDYAVDYEASRSSSTCFLDYLDRLCEELNAIWAIGGKRIVEVGCGDGQFLLSLRRNYQFHGYGFDPSFSMGRIANAFEDVQFVRGYYRPDALSVAPDVVILRHILEHQRDPQTFLSRVLPRAHPGVRVYIEVPAWEWIVDHLQIQAFSYEHCSYYSKLAIQHALERCGVAVEKVTYGFADEYLQYYGCGGSSPRPERHPPSDASIGLIQRTEAFRRIIPRLVDAVREALISRYADAVLWGAAGKGTTLLNVVGLDYTALEYVVDSNPRRHGTYIPCTGQQVVAPEFLTRLNPKQVLLTNPLYTSEIAAQLRDLGLHPGVMTIDDLIRQAADALKTSCEP